MTTFYVNHGAETEGDGLSPDAPFKTIDKALEMTKDLNAEAAAGHGIIVNCNLGLGVKVSEGEGGRVVIEVNPNPLDGYWSIPPVRPDALINFMEETAVRWLQEVAPHRLALGANER